VTEHGPLLVDAAPLARTAFMYEVRWTHPAVADLHGKVRTDVVRRYLFGVARVALDHRSAGWGGRLDNGLWWRRGVLPQDEADPDGIRGGAVDGGREMPYEYVLVYVRSTAAQMPRVFRVLGVLTNGELVGGPAAGLFADGRAADWLPPARSGRDRRLTRPRGGGGDRR
jgi:hypothetical protein